MFLVVYTLMFTQDSTPVSKKHCHEVLVCVSVRSPAPKAATAGAWLQETELRSQEQGA